ncbi:hypothetical protein QVD17_06205 [Tagetes erecta]|uniref:Uncharacterized protein n=1 Tax=Tagetes erecta TaxID=13708 RepID=A0AAD8LN07_TARER|nr:hypothetical protein QVD17_06205 [Tagetes erecta]
MDEFDTKRPNYVNLNEPPPNNTVSEGLWKSYRTSISLGFLATAILISMFIVMAIIEYFFKQNASFHFPLQQASHPPDDPRPMHKLLDSQHVQVGNASELSVLMPGQKYPTYIAHPTPCSREGVNWPSHYQHNNNIVHL